jgi:hypothetical protein
VRCDLVHFGRWSTFPSFACAHVLLQTGQLRAGDMILSANGVSTEDKTQAECLDILKGLPSDVSLVVKFNPLARYHLGEAPKRMDFLQSMGIFRLTDLSELASEELDHAPGCARVGCSWARTVVFTWSCILPSGKLRDSIPSVCACLMVASLLSCGASKTALLMSG